MKEKTIMLVHEDARFFCFAKVSQQGSRWICCADNPLIWQEGTSEADAIHWAEIKFCLIVDDAVASRS